MKALIYPLPDPLHGDNLAREIEGALSLPFDSVVVSRGAELIIGVPDNADEQVVGTTVNAHTGLPTSEQLAEIAAQAEARDAIQSFGPLIAKAKAVYAGTDTFTNAQSQRILAALVLLVYRKLR